VDRIESIRTAGAKQRTEGARNCRIEHMKSGILGLLISFALFEQKHLQQVLITLLHYKHSL